MYKHILMPTDGSELSKRAIESGMQFAAAIGARVTGLYVVTDTLVAKGLGKIMRHVDEGPSAAEVFLKDVSDAAKRFQVSCECFFIEGDSPHEEIVRAAETRACDLIFMATNARRGVAGFLIGSETENVLAESKVPVLVYR